MRRRFLLDTNHLGGAVNPRLGLRDRLRDAHRRGFVLGTCVPVLAELEFGFVQTPHPERNRDALGAIRRFVRLWPLEESLSAACGVIHAELKRIGRTISMTDTLLAAMCRTMNLTLLTTDRDFEALADVRTENWLIVSAARME